MAVLQPSPTNDQASDDDLVGRTLAGDREAFGVLWDRHHQRVYGYGVRRLNNREQAEDAMAETFRRALANLPSYRGDGFRSWLFAIAHNVIVDDIRACRLRTSHETTIDPGDDVILIDERPMREAEAGVDLVHDLLPLLTSGERAVIDLRLAGLSPSEIARALGKDRSAVDMAYHRALVRLRTRLAIIDEANGGSDHE
jgi:RNA polymerase sigma-70 factor, ECF subfamily